MATIEGAFIGKLLAANAVRRAVKDRVWPLVREQGSVLPALVVNVISEVRGVTHAGADGLTFLRIQVDAYGATVKEVREVGAAVAGELHGFQGVAGGVVFQGIFHDARRDSFEGEAPERVFRVSQDFTVWAVAP